MLDSHVSIVQKVPSIFKSNNVTAQHLLQLYGEFEVYHTLGRKWGRLLSKFQGDFSESSTLQNNVVNYLIFLHIVTCIIAANMSNNPPPPTFGNSIVVCILKLHFQSLVLLANVLIRSRVLQLRLYFGNFIP